MTYETYDIYLAGFLEASGSRLQSSRKEGTRTLFCFDKTDKLEELVSDYYNMNAMINPLLYGGALKVLKNIIYQKDGNYNNVNSQYYQQHRKGN